MPGKMKEQQVLEIDPDPGDQTAGIRTPGAGRPTQIVQNRKDRLHPDLNFPGQIHGRIQHLAVLSYEKFEIPVGRVPLGTRSPGKYGLTIIAFHNVAR
jgi:hypothetical protein